MNYTYFSLLILTFFSACSNQHVESNGVEVQSDMTDCVGQKASFESRNQLENGIRGQVRFIGEEENLASIQDKLTEYNIPAASITVIQNGEIAWADIYQNTKFDQDLNCTSIFQAASLSKPVTLMAAVRMQTAGEIDLDENIQSYLKTYDLPQGKQTEDNPVTLRNIFSHTSGITAGGYQGYARDVPMPSDIEVLQGSEGVNSPAIEVVTPPNESLAYSGGAYTLAELALQDKFEDSFSSIMNDWILQPVGMVNSEFTQPLSESESARVAKAHTQSGEELEGGWRNHPEQAAAGLWSNSVDLARFLIAIYNAYHGDSSVFSPSDIKSIINDERDGLAYGFILNVTDDDVMITHYGGNAGYRTGMTISLTTGNGLVYLINSDNGGGLGNELLLSASQIYNWAQFKQVEAKREEVSSDILQGLAGEYKWNDQIDLSVEYDQETDQISLYFPNGDEYKLIPIEGDELKFVHSNTGIEVSFLESENFETFTLYGQNAVKM